MTDDITEQARIETLEAASLSSTVAEAASARIAEVEKERDEYHDVAQNLAQALERVEKERDAAEDGQIRWAALAEKFEKERDAARAHHYTFFHGAYADVYQRLAEVKKERDEARAALREVRDFGYLKDLALWRRVNAALSDHQTGERE